MAENSAIEWTDHTFNPWIGCTKISPACDNCYAAAQDKFRGWTPEGWGGARKRTSAANWRDPIKWNAAAAAKGLRYRVFCASLADVFDNQVPQEWRDDLFALIAATPNLDWLLLTKRIGNAKGMLPATWATGATVPWPNVWIGATIANQEEADRDIPKLLAVPARVRFLSMEPLLGPVDLRRLRTAEAVSKWGDGWHLDALTGRFCHGEPEELEAGRPQINWVITGGESGPGARPSHPDWFRSLRDQCQAAGVPFLFKQHGNWLPVYDRDRDDPDYRRCADMERKYPNGRWLNLAGGHGFYGERVHYVQNVGKKTAGRLLDGRTWDEFPESVK
jgi:protein gp37